jgi:hypothetical protein
MSSDMDSCKTTTATLWAERESTGPANQFCGSSDVPARGSQDIIR